VLVVEAAVLPLPQFQYQLSYRRLDTMGGRTSAIAMQHSALAQRTHSPPQPPHLPL